jgi:hypothetical protein
MKVRNLRRRLVGIMCGALTAAPLIVATAGPAAAAGSEFGVKLRDDSNNGQCVTDNHRGVQEFAQWVGEGMWTEPLVIDTDNRFGGCQLWFGTNNKDGSLTGLKLNYTFHYGAPGNTGECGPKASPQRVEIPVVPAPFDFRLFQTDAIVIDTDTTRNSYCDLTLDMVGSTRSDIALDVKYRFNDQGGQCHHAFPINAPDDRFDTVTTSLPLTIGLDTTNAGGACFLSFRLHRV